VLVFLSILGACEKPREAGPARGPQIVQLVPVMPAGPGQLRDFAGLVEQTSISPLAFEVTGRIIEIAVPEGRPVRKGQLIARIDPEPFELQLRRADAQYIQLAEDLKRKPVVHDCS